VAGELRIAQHAPLLRDAIASVDDELAARAARGSGLIGDIDAVPELLSVLRDESRPWFVRAAAAKAVGMIGDTRAVPALETELAGDAWWVQATAAEALAQLGVEGKHALERASASLRPDVRDHAVAALDQ
jgi:HEAT repeat protein